MKGEGKKGNREGREDERKGKRRDEGNETKI